MKPSAKHSVEPLESRIAPARIIDAGIPNGGPGGPFDVDYKDLDNAANDTIFIDTEINPESNFGAVGAGVIGVADTHYIRMFAGDVLRLDSGEGLQPFITVRGGSIIAFFVDDGDNEVEADELTGVALGKGARVIIAGSVNGDVVTNLDERGTASPGDDQLDLDGLVSDLQTIGGLSVDAVTGSIIAGGTISNIQVSSTVTSILAGTAANGKTYDFYPELPGGDNQLTVLAGAGRSGPSIQNVIVKGVGTLGSVDPTNGLIQAGDGGAGGKGGNITFVRVNLDDDGVRILAGAGGASISTKSGGLGGSVSRIFIGSDADDTVETVSVTAGAGGASALGKGGAGGSLKDVFIGYRLFGAKPFPTTELLIDNVLVTGGAGGNGKIGGAGGSITNADIRVLTAEGVGDEIAVVAGNGGASIVSGGKAGTGGNLLNIVVRNQDLAGGAAYPDILVQGGNGGTAVAGSSGANGGNATNITLLGWSLKVAGGNASAGKVGGNGGSLTNILIEESDEILAIETEFDAGSGGDGTAGNGGKGGNINRILFEDSDLQKFVINADNSGSGGDSVGGKGGAAGSVQAVEVRDNDVSNGATQTASVPLTVRTGTGGDGTKGGGAGGLLKLFTLDSTNVSASISTGAGGSVVGIGAKGKGGAGGNLDTVSMTVRNIVGTELAFANVTAGGGGDGAGANGSGGAGGDLKTVTVNADGVGSLHAGQGGDGDAATGAAGRGGNIQISQLNSRGGNGEMIAGNGGTNGAKPGLGGSILGQNAEVRTSLFAQNDLIVRAGDGTNGGAGGSIRFFGFGSTSNISATPAGNVTIQAGHGSGKGKLVGAGGSVFDASGSLPVADIFRPGEGFEVSINAGNGGAVAGKGAIGGSVQEILILGGGFDGASLTIQAGDAGNGAGAAVGAKGGDVKNITVSPDETGLDTIFRSVVAGDGGDGSKKAGAGGNIEGVFVDGIDIGSRNDEPYGLTQMGGLFAGLAGDGGASPNGKVTTVVAKGIAAIVAGRGLIPEPAELVDNIILSGSNTLLLEDDVFIQPGPFKLAFHVDALVSSTDGTATTPEVQTINLTGLQVASVDLVLSFTFGATTSTTATLPGDATAAQIETALNALPSIKATAPGDTGAVTVTAVAGGFSVTFNSNGDLGSIAVEATAETGAFPQTATATNVENALNQLPTIQYLGASQAGGSVDVTGRNGSFKVTFNQSGDVTPIDGLEVYSVNLTELTQGLVDSSLALETTPGAVNVGVAELVPGQLNLVVTLEADGDVGLPEVQGINLDPVATPGGQFRATFTGSFTSTEVAGGDASTREVQSVVLTAIKADPTATFTLSFGNATTIPLAANASATEIQNALNALGPVVAAGRVTVTVGTVNNIPNTMLIQFNANGARAEVTGAVTSTTALLPGTSDDVALELALNAMAAVKVTAPDYVSGAVDVEPVGATAPNSYLINFLQNGDQQLITAVGLAQEVQEIDHTPLSANPAATFTLSFSRAYVATEGTKGNVFTSERQDINLGGIIGDPNSTFTLTHGIRTTAPLAGNATPAQIEAAIEATGLLIKTVAFAGTTLQLTFQALGDNPTLFTAVGTSTTAPLNATATDVQVQAALNALPTITGATLPAESVTVVSDPAGDPDGDFVVTFSGSGQRAPIVASLVQQEVQEFSVNSIIVEPTGNFRLGYAGEFTTELLPTATSAEVQAALNLLSSVLATGPGGVNGSVTVTEGTLPGEFVVQFNNGGDRTLLEVRSEVDEVQDVDFIPGSPITLTVDHDVTAIEAVAGGPGVPEIQILNMGAILGTAEASYYFTLGGLTSATLPGTADAAAIKLAIDQMLGLPVGDPNGVVVDVDLIDRTVQVSFAIEGDQPTLIAHASQTVEDISPTATASDVKTILDGMATVRAKAADGVSGSVTVTVGTGSNFVIRFNDGGDQLPISGTQERPLQLTTLKEGTAVIQEIQAFSPEIKGQPISSIYALANLIGFYSDHTELDANIFHFIHEGVLTDSTERPFQLGDQPIDGLVIANKMNQARISVTPEAYWVGGFFYDWNNRI